MHLQTCEQAKGDMGQQMMKDIARLVNASVIGYDAGTLFGGGAISIQLVPMAREWETGGIGMKYPFKQK